MQILKSLKRIVLLTVVIGLLGLTNNVYAKWWIFGKSSGTPEINKIFVANMNVESIDGDLVLYKDNLDMAQVLIKGFVARNKIKTALAEVSLDDGMSWEKADLNSKGFFEYRFTPEENKEYYLLFRVMDVNGLKSDVNDFRKIKLVYKAVEATDIVKTEFAKMIQAYTQFDSISFMGYVSDEFKGDKQELQEGVERDFSTFSTITLDANVDNVITEGVFAKVYVTFDLRLVALKDGAEQLVPQKQTVCTFRLEGEKYKLFDVATPTPFGLTNAAAITTGAGLPTVNDNEIVNEQGGIVSNFDWQGTITLTTANDYPSSVYSQGYIFSTDSRITNNYADTTGVDVIVEDGTFWFGNNGGGMRITNPKLAPESGYLQQVPEFGDPMKAGDYFAVKTGDGNYAIIEVVSYIDNVHTWTATFKYKYREDGGREF